MNKNTTVPSSSRTIKERGKIDVYNTQIHDQSLSCLATCTAMKIGGGELNKLYGPRFPSW